MHRLLTFLFAVLPSVLLADPAAIDEGFEDAIPDFHTYRAGYVADTAHAHTGAKSLRVDPQDSPTGGAYFRLDGVIDTARDYEFSAWVWAGSDGAVSLYVSAAGEKGRFVVSRTGGGVKNKWVQLVGHIRRKQWQGADRQVMLAMTTKGTSWFDDVILRTTTLPDPPIEMWPTLEPKLRAAADGNVTALSRGREVTLGARRAALALDMKHAEVSVPRNAHITLAPDSVLTFAVDAPMPMYVTGTLSLTHGDDLRPGLRAYVFCDTTLVATPMVAAPPWQSIGGKITGSAPAIAGAVPPEQIELTKWLLPAGRHYLTIAGPHFRGAGLFRSLTIKALADTPRTPRYRFALFSDTHLGQGRSTWMNNKLCGAVGAELTHTFTSLREQGVAFAIIAGDMTDSATRSQFSQLAGVLKNSGLPVYGCVGNHDAYHSSSRPDQLELLPAIFPGGRTDYAFERLPLRFVVLDASYWRTKEGGFTETYERGKTRGIGLKPEQIEWLRSTLAADPATPTVVVWHYASYNRGGVSSCGYKLPACRDKQILDTLEAAPNVIATMNGHKHWNSVDRTGGITCIQNAAFVEWPNMYRVFRVYDDHLEWEVRLANSFGFVRESFVPEKALSWVISTQAGDLAGRISLRRSDH